MRVYMLRFMCLLLIIPFFYANSLLVEAAEIPIQVSPQSGSEPSLMGSYFEFNKILADGDILVNVGWQDLAIYDVSDPENIALVKSIRTGTYQDVAFLQDGILFTISGQSAPNMLSIWDLKNPTSPKLKVRRSLLHMGGLETKIALSGSTLALAQHKTLNLYDVSNLSRPLLKQSTELPVPVEYMEWSGQKLHLAMNIDRLSEPRILTYTVANFNAQLASSFTLPNTSASYHLNRFSGMVVYNNTLYVSHFTKTYALDMTNPANPSIIATHTSTNNSVDLTIYPDQQALVITEDNSNSEIFNISNPSQITHIKRSPHRLGFSTQANNIVWVPYFSWVLGIDISDIEQPDGKYSINTINGASIVSVHNNIAYIGWGGGHLGGFSTLDVTNPQAALVLDNYELNADVYDLKIAGNKAYISTSTANSKAPGKNFLILDVSVPSDIKLLGSRNITSGISGLDIAGSYAYITTQNALQTINVSNPSAPSIIHSIPAPAGQTRSLQQVENGRAYIISQSTSTSNPPRIVQEILVYSLENPTQPTHIGTLPYRAGGVVVGNLLYTAGDNAETILETPNPRLTNQHSFQIVDISNPAQPVVKSKQTKVFGCRVIVEGTLAYIHTCIGQILIFDVSDPTKPKRISSLWTGGRVGIPDVESNYIYVPFFEGMSVYSFTPSALSSNSVTQVQVDTQVSTSQRTEHGAISPAQADQRVLPNTELTISTRNPDGTVIPSNAILHLYDNSGQSTLPTYVVFTPDAKGQMKVPVSLPMNTTLTISVVDYERGIGTNIVVDTSAYRSYLPVLSR